MPAVLSNEVKQALQDIYYNERTGRGKEALALLEKASADGDGDATCVLARCYCGRQYVWAGHRFPEDDAKATRLLRKSVEQGSALGVLVALRSGELPPSVEKKMPFASLQEALDEALELAEGGDAFAQYVVANSYFWWDFLRIQNKGRDDFPSHEAFRAYLKENISKCEDWFWKALRGGVYFAANNLNKYYREGDEDIIAPQPEKARDLYKIGAEAGHPIMQAIYADDLREAGRKEEAAGWYEKAAEGGHPGAWYSVGRCYFNGEGVGKDAAYAVTCFEKELAGNPIHEGSCNLLGKAYFYGEGVRQDYDKAYRYLSTAYQKQNSTWGVFYLAKCSFNGWGTPQDFRQAMAYMDKMTFQNPEADYMRGYIHARGLGGMPEDIKTGVQYLQKAGNLDKAKEELLRYKKTLFGRWVRRR